MANARLLVEVAASLGTFREDLGRAAATAENSAKRIEGAFSGAQARISETGKKILGTLVGTLGVAAITRELSVIREKTIDEARSFAQLDAVLTSTGHAAGLTADQLNKLGQEVKDSTVFDDDDIRKAETALLRFRDVQGEVFKDTIRLAPGVATVLGTDLPTAAIALGRALSGEGAAGMKALKAAGVGLGDQVIDLAARMDEAGDKAGSMRLKLDEIRKSIGAAGGADAQGLYGQTKNLTRAWDDLQKAVGRKLFGNDSFITRELTTSLEGLAFALENINRLRITAPLFPGGLPGISFDGAPTKGRGAGIKKIDTSREDQFQATVGELKARADQESESRYAKLKLELQKAADAAAAFYAGELLLQKSAIELEQDALEFGYSRGEVSAEEYYGSIRRLSASNLLAITQDLTQQYEAQEKVRNAVIPGTDKPLFDLSARLDAWNKMTGLGDQANVARFAFFKQDQQFTQKQIADTEKLGDAYGELSEKIARAQGNEQKASAIAFERENREQRRRLERIRDTGNPQQEAGAIQELAKLKLLDDIGDAQAQLTSKTRDYQNVVESLGIAQGRLDLEAQTGSLTEIDLLNKKAELARVYVPLLTAQADAQEAITRAALASGALVGPEKDAALLRLQQMRLGIDQLAASTDALAIKFNKIFEDGFSDAFTSFLDGTKSAKDAFKDFTKSVLHDINSIVSKQIANAIFGGPSSATGGIFGSLLASLFGGGAAAHSLGGGAGGFNLSSLFSSGGGPFTSGGAPVDIGAGYGAFASGTRYAPGGMAMVGEHGPEAMFVPRGAQIIPNHELVARREARAGVSITQNINVPVGTSRATRDQISRDAMREAQRATRIM